MATPARKGRAQSAATDTLRIRVFHCASRDPARATRGSEGMIEQHWPAPPRPAGVEEGRSRFGVAAGCRKPREPWSAPRRSEPLLVDEWNVSGIRKRAGVQRHLLEEAFLEELAEIFVLSARGARGSCRPPEAPVCRHPRVGLPSPCESVGPPTPRALSGCGGPRAHAASVISGQ